MRSVTIISEADAIEQFNCIDHALVLYTGGTLLNPDCPKYRFKHRADQHVGQWVIVSDDILALFPVEKIDEIGPYVLRLAVLDREYYAMAAAQKVTAP